MKFNNLILVLIAVLFLMPSPAQAQHRRYEDNTVYIGSAKEKSLLTRGVLAPEYQFMYNGTFYAETKEFKTGEVLYNNRIYSGVKLNIDACRNLLVVSTGIITATARDFVEYAVIGEDRYVNLQFGNKVKNAPEGFCKEIFSGEVSFYTLVRKALQTSPGYHNGDDIGYVDPDYRSAVRIGNRDVPVDTFFSYSRRCYAVKDGECYQIRNRRALLKLFDKAAAKKMKKHASAHGLNDMGVSLEAYAAGVLSYWQDNLMEGAE